MHGFDDKLRMVTQIIQVSGETRDRPLLMPPVPAHPQEAGSFISYFKRYALCAVFGIVSEDDDDASLATRSDSERAVLTHDQVAELKTIASERGADLDRFCRYMGVGGLEQLTARDFGRAKSVLMMRRAA